LGTVALLALIACSSGSSGNGGGNDAAATCAMPGGAVSGPQDTHCIVNGMRVAQPTSMASCYVDAAAGGDDGGGGGNDGGAAGDDGGAVDAGDIGNCGDPEFGATMFNQSAADDDCKYDVTWTSTPICENSPVTFTVTAKNRTDNSPLTGAAASWDAGLNCAHTSPSIPSGGTETSPGTYTVGPIVFDKPGKWVVRFHFYENCFDIVETSPHGHAAFWIQVP
jgi:hypothetical protein